MQPRGTMIVASLLLAASCAVLVLIGCRRNGDTLGSKLKIAYVGLTCEAPLFVAVEKGYCKDEGLDVELIATDWDGLREGLGLGRFHASQTLLMYLIKPIAEQGLDVKITGGIHTGCLRLQAGTKTSITSPRDLKGKTIGVPTHLGSPPHLFAARVLAAHGIDPSQEAGNVTWLFFPPDLLGKALEDGRVDAVATSDPIGTILVGMGLAKTIADQAVDAPYADEYCCVVVVSGQLAGDNPQAAAKLTRALLKASKWVEHNSAAAARLAVEKKYVAASEEINCQALAALRYTPAVAQCRRSIDQAARDMQKAGLLKGGVDPNLAAQRAWLDLNGVTDDWLERVAVEHVQGGGRPRPLAPAAFADLCRTSRVLPGMCCPN
jgi:NitT/TauT family transport system substrate-binding protein